MLPLAFRYMCATTLVVTILGCQGKENAKDEPLTWKQVEAALESPNVRSIRDLYQQIADTPTKNTRPFYADLDEREAEFQPIEEYLATSYSEASHPGITPDQARKMIPQDMTTWKTDRADVNAITRVYLIGTRHATMAKRMAHWDAVIYFDVFTNDDGVIIGWRIIR